MAAAEVDAALAAALSGEFDRLFGNGWQPAELHRAIARRGNPIQARLVADAARDFLRGRQPVDERWQAQADALRTPEGRRPDRIAVLDASLELVAELESEYRALGERVLSRMYRNRAEKLLSAQPEMKDAVFYVHPRRISVMVGQKRENTCYLRERFGLSSIKVRPIGGAEWDIFLKNQ